MWLKRCQIFYQYFILLYFLIAVNTKFYKQTVFNFNFTARVKNNKLKLTEGLK